MTKQLTPKDVRNIKTVKETIVKSGEVIKK